MGLLVYGIYSKNSIVDWFENLFESMSFILKESIISLYYVGNIIIHTTS